MKPLKILNSLAAVAVLGGVFSAFLEAPATKVSASDNVQESAPVNYTSAATEVDPSEMKVSVLGASSTKTSQSFTFNFSSSITYHKTTMSDKIYSGVNIVSFDPSCPADSLPGELTKYDFDLDKFLAKDRTMVSNAKKWIETDEEGNYLKGEDGKYVFKTDENGVPSHGYTTDMPVYDGFVYEITPPSGYENLVIPNYINRKDCYMIRVTSIGSNVFKYRATTNSNGTVNVSNNLDDPTYNTIKNIFIGDSVTTIEDDAFKGITTDYTGESAINLNILSSASSLALGTDWAGNANVHFNYDFAGDTTLSDTLKNQLVDLYHNNVAGELNVTGEDVSESSFVFGSAQENKPMTLEYTVEIDGRTEVRHQAFKLEAKDTGVGNLAGKHNVVQYVDIHKEEAAKVDPDSLVIRNIFGSKEKLEADTSVEYYCVPGKAYRENLAIEDFITIGSQRIRKFGEYTSFTINVDKVADIYQKVNPSSWKQYADKVANGDLKIRYSFVGFNASEYEVTYVKNGVDVTKTISFNNSAENGITLNFHLLTQDKNNAVTFLLKNKLIDDNFNIDTVKKVEYKGASFKLDLMNTKKGTTQIVTKSDVVTRFGYVEIYSKNEHKAFNADLFLTIMEISFLAGYLLVATGYYFFAKNKYKNDEFRRMNTRKYIKEAVIGFIGGGIVYSALLFIILRFGLFNVSVIVYNPLDPLVMIFGIVGIVIVGLFIKKLITVIKVGNERRKTMKLKLNEDVVDDGTK